MSALGRNLAIVRKALADDRARRRAHLRIADPDFLPAALEVIERPVSPTGRITAWVLLAGVAATGGWLFLGHVDIVASAPGRVVPTGNVKIVQAASTGVVRRIYITDGDAVKAGQPLIDLDPTVSTAEESEASKALLAAELDVARNRAIADAIGGGAGRFAPPANASPEVVDTQRRLIADQVAAARAEGAALAAARASALAEAQGAADQVRQYDETAPILQREVASMNALAAKGYAPGLKLLELERQYRTELGQRDLSAAQRAKSLSDARRFGQQLGQARAQATQTALDALAKAQNEVILRREEVTKARRRSHLQRLLAPVDGTVQQLAVHTLGGVVEPVRTLLVVVPNGTISVEARVRNRDAGFVRVGAPVSVKFEAFPYTRYGTIPGRIASISRDAIQDQKTGAYFLARVALARSTIEADGAVVPLTAGLNTTSDIRIGSRRIIDFILSPIRETGSEAGHEK